MDSHWDTNSAFFQAAVKSEENSTKNETVKLPIPMEPTVELLSNTVAVEVRFTCSNKAYIITEIYLYILILVNSSFTSRI